MNFSQKQAALVVSQQCHQAQGDQEAQGNGILKFLIVLTLRHTYTQAHMHTYTDKHGIHRQVLTT